MTIIRLREAGIEDAPILLALVQQSFEEYRGVLHPPSSAHRETLDIIRQKMTEGGAFLAWVGELAAGGVVYEPRENALYLGRLSVLPAYRKQGIAHHLVEAVEDRARMLEVAKVTLSVRLQLPGNRVFFERLGYQVVAYHAHEGYAEPTFITLEKLV